MSSEKLIFYTNNVSAHSQRVAIVLKESGADYDSVFVDLVSKPTWLKDVTPDLKIPVIKSNGQSIAESLIINEYISDLFPEKNLLPKEPLRRANVRFAIELFGSKAAPQLIGYCRDKEVNAVEKFKNNLNAVFKRLNELLLQESASGPYFLGEQFSIADAAIAPFLVRLYALAHFIDEDFEFDEVKNSQRLAQFVKGVSSRPSVQETYCGDAVIIEVLQKKFGLSKS